MIRIDGDVRYLAVDVLVGEEGFGLGICHSGNCRARGFAGDAPCGVVEGAGFGCFWKFRPGSRGRKEGRKKEREKERKSSS